MFSGFFSAFFTQAKQLLIGLLLVLSLESTFVTATRAEKFVVIDEQREQREIVGRIYASGQGAYAIQSPGGEIEVLAHAAVIERNNTVPWEPFEPQQLAEKLASRFGTERFRHEVDGNFVIGMVLMDEIPKQSEIRVTAFLKKAARFMNNVQNVFVKFTRDLRLEIRDPDVPLVLLIFESDEDFNTYTDDATQGQSLSSANIAGFYSGLTNYLAIRMTECTTFEVPLHEAIHQQVYNRGLLQRLAPIPAWFNEGIATGFEAQGDRIGANPAKVHPQYAEKYEQAQQVTWNDLILNDQAFRGDILASDAYCHGWALHWLLVTRHAEDYARYVKLLAAKQPLTKEDAGQREQEFYDHFGDDIASLQQEYQQAIQRALKTQRIVKDNPSRPGYLRAQQALADLELTAITRAQVSPYLEVEARLKNINPFRQLTFRVMITTETGGYTEWIVPDVTSNRIANLPKQYVSQTKEGLPAIPAGSFRVQVQSALPESSMARGWQAGTGKN